MNDRLPSHPADAASATAPARDAAKDTPKNTIRDTGRDPARDAAPKGEPGVALAQADAALATRPDDTTAWTQRIRALIALHHRDEAARQAATLVAQGRLTAETLDTVMAASLAAGDLRGARAAIAAAEAEDRVPAWARARAKAQVAIAAGDVEAATAILVAGIETAPDNAALRAQLTEALMAGGSAGHVRDVLTHLGLPPAQPNAPDAPDAPDGNVETG